jgi:hypothetical protein
VVAEEVATESISAAREGGGVSEDNARGLADPDESAGKISPEEDPTTSYRGARDRQEQRRERASGDTPGGRDTGRDMTGRAEGKPGDGEMRPGETLREEAPASEGESAASGETGEAVPTGKEVARPETIDDESNDTEEG